LSAQKGLSNMLRIWRLVSLPSLLLVLCLTVAAGSARSAQPEVVAVPPPDAGRWTEVKAAPGKLLVLSAEPASKWLLVDDGAGADLRTFEAGKFGAFVAPLGRHRIIVTGPDGTPAKIVVVVGDAPPGPPGPGPGPSPPVPPVPPVDQLAAKLRAAFDADLAPVADRRKHAAALAELYRQIAERVCPDPAITGPTMLFDRARESAKILVGTDALLGVRKVVGEELANIFPVEAPLTKDQRDAAGRLFRRLAEVLDGF
jgi:hypothetical protein